MSEWQETEFGKIPSCWDYLRIENTDLQIGDGNYSSKYPRASELLSEGVPFISSTDLSNGKISANNLRYISTEHHSRLLKGHIKQGDVLIVVRGNGVGQVGLVSEEYEDANLNAQMAYLGRSNKIDGAFLYYLLSKYYSDGVTETVVSGSAQPQITVGSLKQLSLIVPPIEEQKAIASVLSSLDDKIDLLHSQNSTLERMAGTLFRQWFVEEAQESWEEISFGEFVKPKKGKNITKVEAIEGIYPVIAGGLTPSCFHNKCNTNAPVITISASGANAGFVCLYHAPVWSSDSSYIDDTITKYVYFCYVFLKYNQSILTDKQEGSAQPHIYPSHIMDLGTLNYPLDLIETFENQIKGSFEKIKLNQKQIQTLEKLRDNLLPKLMSGEVRVNVKEASE